MGGGAVVCASPCPWLVLTPLHFIARSEIIRTIRDAAKKNDVELLRQLTEVRGVGSGGPVSVGGGGSGRSLRGLRALLLPIAHGPSLVASSRLPCGTRASLQSCPHSLGNRFLLCHLPHHLSLWLCALTRACELADSALLPDTHDSVRARLARACGQLRVKPSLTHAHQGTRMLD